jgi:hypothetical protein
MLKFARNASFRNRTCQKSKRGESLKKKERNVQDPDLRIVKEKSLSFGPRQEKNKQMGKQNFV